MIPGDIYIHKNMTGFGCDKIIQVMRMEIGAKTAEVLTYSVADAGCTAETINISDVIYDRAWFLICGESLCDLLHKYYVDCEVCKEMLEAHNATIITFIITLNEQLKRLEVENKKLKDSILCDPNEQADPEIEEVIE